MLELRRVLAHRHLATWHAATSRPNKAPRAEAPSDDTYNTIAMATRKTTPYSPLAAARRVMTFVCVCLVVASTATSSSCSTHGCRMHSHRHHHKSSSSSSGSRRKKGESPSCGGGRRYGHAVACWATPVGGRIGWFPRMRTEKVCACSLTTRGMTADRASRAAPVRSLLTMKARSKKGRGGGGRQGGKGGATATAAGRGGTKQKKAALYIQIEDLESDSWRYAYKAHEPRVGNGTYL